MNIFTILKTTLLAGAVCVPALIAPAFTPSAAEKPRAALVQNADAERWADSVMARMSTRGKVGQLFIPRLDVFDNAAGHASLKKMVTQGQVGGFLLGKGTVAGYANLIRGAQDVAKVPLLVTLDGEWGLSMRLSDAPRFPYSMGLGAITDAELLYEYGREMARECREVGIHVNFAPVLDVNSNPSNPVIGYRSFGENPQRVSALGCAYAKGLEDGGVMAVGKHFPGHGDTSVDSHKALPTVDHSASTLEDVDLVPFRDFINGGFGGIMVGHLKVPALDASGTPASLSKRVSTDLLKKEMGFGGLVFTDALAMKGAVAKPGENNCVTALKAGADVLLGSGSPYSDIEAVMAAVNSGVISKERIDESCRKILAAKYQLGLADGAVTPRRNVKEIVNGPSAKSVNGRLAAGCITAVRNASEMLPLGNLGSTDIAVVSIGAPASNEFSKFCAKYARVSEYSVGKEGLGAAELQKINKADVVIAAVFNNSASSAAALDKLAAHPGAVGVVFVNPYKMSALKAGIGKLKTFVAAYDDTPALRRAAAQALFGGIAVSGRFPVNVNGIAREGEGTDIAKSRLGYTSPQDAGFSPDLQRRVDSIAKACVAAGAFPGCQVVVARKGNVVIESNYGKIERGGTAPVTDNTIYDIASMTKAVATAGGIMKAYDEGLFGLKDRVSKFVPGLRGTDKENLTVEQLLYHESGMPASLNMIKIMTDPASYTGPLTKSRARAPYTVKVAPGVYAHSSARKRTDIVRRSRSEGFDIEMAKGVFVGSAAKDTIMERIYNIGLRSSKRYLYSCLNFCLLMDMEERLTGVDHDQWVDTELFGPLGAVNTCFRPLDRYSASQIAPTENDTYLRGQTVRGYVHDEVAAFSGGVQGNAGLFSTAGDIAKYSQMLLQKGVYGPERLLSEKTVDLFTRSRSGSGRRALAFDLASGLRSLDETGAGVNTFGHTGFTGTCFWIDPEEELVFVFLSNRINPSRSNRAFSDANPRGQLLQAVYSALR
ncbi:MAG: serine hydrolase [Muribaculaceae bacterium]|nr:serine hydrolase [Muribaculaceae bacterium]